MTIVAVNGQPIRFYDEFEDIKQASAGKPIALTVIRDGVATQLKGKVPKDKILGFGYKDPMSFFQLATVKYGPIQAIGKGFSYTFDQFGNYGRQL